jgi:membrane protein
MQVPFVQAAGNWVWREDLDTLPVWRAMPVRAIRVVLAVGRDLIDGQLFLHASSLVYTTLLSMVPLLALAFSLLKGLGLQDQLGPMLESALKPIGPEAVAVSDRLLAFVDNIHAGVLGTVGIAFLVYTSVSVGRKVEAAFNEIWRVARGRSLTRSVTSHLSLLLLGPLLLFAALGLAASLFRSTPLQELSGVSLIGQAIATAADIAPFMITCGALAIVYMVLPNTRVRFVPALIGAIAAALLFWLAGQLFAVFVAGSTSYTAIYSAFAALIIFLIWLNAAWTILLIGAAVAYYCQHPPCAQALLDSAGRAGRWQIAALIMLAVARSQYLGGPPITLQEIRRSLRVADAVVDAAIEDLQAAGLLCCSADDPPRLLPARPLDVTPATALWEATAGKAPTAEGGAAAIANGPLADYERLIRDSVAAGLGERTLKDLALAGDAASIPTDSPLKPL